MSPKDPNILAIETSSPLLTVALKKGKGKIEELSLEGFPSHAENLLPFIDRLLKKARLKIEDIHIFLIGRGPGSFTGLRIGYATLKGFSILQKKDCFGALSHDTIAEKIKLPENSNLAVVLDARRERIYQKLYQFKKGSWIAVTDIQVLSFEDSLRALPKETHLVGDALLRYREKYEAEAKNKKLSFLPPKKGYPLASTLITLFEKSTPSTAKSSEHLSLHPFTHPSDFIPFYFRLSEAEERKLENANA